MLVPLAIHDILESNQSSSSVVPQMHTTCTPQSRADLPLATPSVDANTNTITVSANAKPIMSHIPTNLDILNVSTSVPPGPVLTEDLLSALPPPATREPAPIPKALPVTTGNRALTSTSVGVPTSTNGTVSAAITEISATSAGSGTTVTPPGTSAPIVVVRQLQVPKPYSEQTSHKSFRLHFERIARCNQWVTEQEKVQNLCIALEGPALDCIWDLSEHSEQLARRFGHLDEPQKMMRRFDARKQQEGETVVEFEQALRILYSEAWPNADPECKHSALKRKFEEGLSSPEMIQFLRLHARDDDFAQTVAKARQFVDAQEAAKPKKAIRIATAPDHGTNHENANAQPYLQPLLDGFQKVIEKALEDKHRQCSVHCMSPTRDRSRDGNVSSGRSSPSQARVGTPFKGQSTVNERNLPAETLSPSDERLNNGDRRSSGTSGRNRGGLQRFQNACPRSSGPWNGQGHVRDGWSGRQNTSQGCQDLRSGPHTDQRWRGNNRTQPPPTSSGDEQNRGSPSTGSTWRPNRQWQNRQRQFGHDRFVPQPQGTRRMNRTCYACGRFGCHSRFHHENEAERNDPPHSENSGGNTASNIQLNQGNSQRGQQMGMQAPPTQSHPRSN